MCVTMYKQIFNKLKVFWYITAIGSIFVTHNIISFGQNRGSILSFIVTGGVQPGDTITTSLTVQAKQNIPQSNMYIEIRSPNGTVELIHPIVVPSLSTGETFSYTWTFTNSSFSLAGNHNAALCWIPENSQNCLVSSSNIIFHPANTFSSLKWIGLLIISIWIFRSNKYLSAGYSQE